MCNFIMQTFFMYYAVTSYMYYDLTQYASTTLLTRGSNTDFVKQNDIWYSCKGLCAQEIFKNTKFIFVTIRPACTFYPTTTSLAVPIWPHQYFWKKNHRINLLGMRALPGEDIGIVDHYLVTAKIRVKMVKASNRRPAKLYDSRKLENLETNFF